MRLRRFDLAPGPVEPGHERFHIGVFDRRAGPDAQARRRVAISADIEGDALLLEEVGDLLCRGRLRVLVQCGEPGIDYFQTDARVRPRLGIAGEEIAPTTRLRPTIDDVKVFISARDERL